MSVMCCATPESGAAAPPHGGASAAAVTPLASSSPTTSTSTTTPTTRDDDIVVNLSRPLAQQMDASRLASLARITPADIEQVKFAIENELSRERGPLPSDDEIIEKLSPHFQHPLLISIVLTKLREQNVDFFAAYDAERLACSMSMEPAVPDGGEPACSGGNGNGDDAVVPTGSFASMVIC